MELEPIAKSTERAMSIHDYVHGKHMESYGSEWVERNQSVVDTIALMVQIERVAKEAARTLTK